jgi:hypothetical protein
MATVMISKDGKGRCDATCHEANSLVCRCVCEGRYHGRSSAYQPKPATDVEALVAEDAANGRLSSDQLLAVQLAGMKPGRRRKALAKIRGAA